jgi:hypothetical protein
MTIACSSWRRRSSLPGVELRRLVKRLAVAGCVLLVAACGPRDAQQGPATGAGVADGAPPCEVVGEWRHEHPTYASDIAICVEPGGSHRVRQVFQDGSSFEADVVPIAGASGERFLRAAGFSDYYEVLPDGRLVLGDDEGVIATAEPLR